MKLYAYGVIDSNDQMSESICGLEGASVYNIPYCDLGLVVSELSSSIQATQDNILAHEDVVERLMADFTVLPVKFRTVFDGRDDVLSVMRFYYEDFRHNMDRVQNKVEFGIKVIWPADKIKENIVKTLKKTEQSISTPDNSSNKRFIKEKFEEYRIDNKFKAKANRFVDVMDMFFGKFAAEKKLGKLKTKNLLLDAVYLVEKNRQDDFRKAFGHIKSAHTGFKFLFSGPWPPYNFVILSKKSGLLRDSERADLFGGVAQCQVLVGVDGI